MPVKTRHSRVGGNPRHRRSAKMPWIPAYAGMTGLKLTLLGSDPGLRRIKSGDAGGGRRRACGPAGACRKMLALHRPCQWGEAWKPPCSATELARWTSSRPAPCTPPATSGA
ncbi:hypothetical protein F0185_08365 [Massilia sp. CCM 8692]|uniref:Uncharacterized protein n=1 Tax=Massilia rubra TaxID=2607910 RepID=A0ABX0LLR5_9BURK|nr:hypothetical protein [Massilia rubra]